jgi:two-component system, sensor histidine kinase
MPTLTQRTPGRWDSTCTGVRNAPQDRGRARVIETMKKAAEQRVSPTRRILLVEDNRDGRESMRVLLELLGHRVVTADNGFDGLARGMASAPEVAVLDIGLPGLDGYQLARQLRRNFGHTIYLIAHTGYGQPEDRRRAFEAGFDAHLVKPVDLNELAYLLTWLPGKSRD